MPPEDLRGESARRARDLTSPVTRAVLGLWARDGKWAEIALAGLSMSPLIPDGSRLTVRFGRCGLAPGDVILYASGERVIAHRVVRLGRRGRRWGFIKVKGDPLGFWEASWIPVEDVLGRVVALRRPDGSAVLLNTLAARLANRTAAAISQVGARVEGAARSVLGASRDLRAAPAMLALLDPLYRAGTRRGRQEAGLLLSAEERLLLAAARVRPAPEDEMRVRRMLGREILWERVIASASTLGLAPLLYRNLGRPLLRDRVPPPVLAALGRAAHAAACRMAVQIEALRQITGALERSGIDPILLKGAALALTLYDQPALRPMDDLDFLVEAGRLVEAVSVVEGLGFRTIAGGRPASFYETHHHAPPMIGWGGRVIVEVHRGLIPPDDGVRLDAGSFAARAVSVDAGGLACRVLAREDQILHAALHLSYADRFVGALRDLIDLHTLVDFGPREVDWGVLLGSARTPSAARSLSATLDLARRLLGTAVPQEVMNELGRAAGWDPLAARLLRLCARASLFAGAPSDALLSDASARWICGTLLKRSGWGARLRDLVQILGEA